MAVPVIQAPMAGTCTPGLAAAVSYVKPIWLDRIFVPVVPFLCLYVGRWFGAEQRLTPRYSTRQRSHPAKVRSLGPA